MFATDFPHIENEWPNSRPIIDDIYKDIPVGERDKIWAGNAVKYFSRPEGPSSGLTRDLPGAPQPSPRRRPGPTLRAAL